DTGRITPQQRRRRWRGQWLAVALLPLALLWAWLDTSDDLDVIKDEVLDRRFRWRGTLEAPVNIVYVDIDSQAIDELGNFPWNRDRFAVVCKALLNEAKVKAIGIDVLMSEAGMPHVVNRAAWDRGNAELGGFLFGDPPPPVVLAAAYTGAIKRDAEGNALPVEIPPAGSTPADYPERPRWKGPDGQWRPAPYQGLIDTLGNGTRFVPMFAPLPDGSTVLHMSLELARLRWGVPKDGIRIRPNRIEIADTAGKVVRRIPLLDGQFIPVNWFSAWKAEGQNPRVSFADVYTYAGMLDSENGAERAAAREFFGQEGFRDAVVLIGATDRLMHDLAPTPFDRQPVPKVGIYGNVLKSLAADRFLRYPPWWLAWLVTGAAGYLTTRGFAGAAGRWERIIAIVLGAAYVVLVFVAFSKLDWALPLAAPVGGALSAGFAGLGVQVIVERRQRNRLQGMFGSYVSPEVVKRLVESGEEPKLGGVEEEITAYFSDVQMFASVSEKLTPTQLVGLMNEYLGTCADMVQAQGGTLDKFVGDAVVAMFGAPVALPDHAHRACITALRVQERLGALRRQWVSEMHRNLPAEMAGLHTRIGLNSGRAVVGNMGSRTRFNYTMMGDTVNLAARLESAARQWGVVTLCTAATKAGCEAVEPERVVFRRLNNTVVMGRSQPVEIYEVVGLREQVSAETHECLRIFGLGLRCYNERDWAGARAAFRESARLEPHKPGEVPGVTLNPSLALLGMVSELQTNPPWGDWDGSYRMREK
ncbi:MAG: adenylate/guanylate cyclase domain-containing protein, partial [Opitutaceae bacterium]|nr:adenylate/guanylate cyclase domain-containing protein [Opitutaceae bacterium]